PAAWHGSRTALPPKPAEVRRCPGRVASPGRTPAKPADAWRPSSSASAPGEHVRQRLRGVRQLPVGVEPVRRCERSQRDRYRQWKLEQPHRCWQRAWPRQLPSGPVDFAPRDRRPPGKETGAKIVSSLASCFHFSGLGLALSLALIGGWWDTIHRLVAVSGMAAVNDLLIELHSRLAVAASSQAENFAFFRRDLPEEILGDFILIGGCDLVERDSVGDLRPAISFVELFVHDLSRGLHRTSRQLQGN